MADPDPLAAALEAVKTRTAAKGAVGDFARQLLPLLEEARGHAVRRRAARGTGEIEYVVEKTQQGEVLTERRLSGRSKPFRCPKAVYDAVVAVLAETPRPMSLDEIVAGIEKRLGERPAEFHVRVPLRLWMHVQPSLLRRSRARYGRSDGSDFPAAATAAWHHLRGPS